MAPKIKKTFARKDKQANISTDTSKHTSKDGRVHPTASERKWKTRKRTENQSATGGEPVTGEEATLDALVQAIVHVEHTEVPVEGEAPASVPEQPNDPMHEEETPTLGPEQQNDAMVDTEATKVVQEEEKDDPMVEVDTEKANEEGGDKVQIETEKEKGSGGIEVETEKESEDVEEAAEKESKKQLVEEGTDKKNEGAESESEKTDEENGEDDPSSKEGSEEDHIQEGRQKRLHEQVAEADSVEDEDDSEEVTETEQEKPQVPEHVTYGGPEDLSLLVDLKTHVSYSIWTTEVRRSPLDCRHHRHQVSATWDPEEEPLAVRNIINRSGLMPLIRYARSNVDSALVTAFVDRWYPETNSFHLAFGEMTITLHDVSRITGLPIVGMPVVSRAGEKKDDAYYVRMFGEHLGIDAEELMAQKRACSNGRQVKLYWLASHQAKLSGNETPNELKQRARRFLLFLLGCTILSDKSGDKIPWKYVDMVIDLDRIGEYNWGATMLCLLYRHLGQASRAHVRSIAGYLPLLEVWILDYFRWRGCLNVEYRPCQPTLNRWISSSHYGESKGPALDNLREYLDTITVQHVDWQPLIDHYPIDPINWYVGCIVALDINEAYMPGRVVRQFGRVQHIPVRPYIPVARKRTADGLGYKVDFGHTDQYMLDWQNHTLTEEQRGQVCVFAGQSTIEYLPWFYKVSHPVVVKPSMRLHGRLMNGTWDEYTVHDTLRKSTDLVQQIQALDKEADDWETKATELEDRLHTGLLHYQSSGRKPNMLWQYDT